MTALWSGPDALADDLLALCGPLPLLPPAPPPTAGDDVVLLLADSRTRLAEGMSAEGDAYFTALLAAADGGMLNKTSYKSDWLSLLHRQLMAWVQHPALDVPMQDKLVKLTLDALTKGTKKDYAGKTPLSPLQPLIADYVVALERYTQWRRSQSILLLHRLRDDARRRLDDLKRTRRVQTYDDLIERVAVALDGPQRQALVAALRAQYRVCLLYTSRCV